MDSDAYSVNDSLIFRFPKSSYVRKNLKKEVAVLPIICSKLDVEIPQFTFVAKDYSFVGYKKLEGEFLTAEIFANLSTSEQIGIQKDIARFLTQMHNTDIADLKNSGISTADYKTEYQADFADAQKNVFPSISAENRAFIAEQLQLYVGDANNFSYAPVLLHNDLSAEHILFDARTKKITGIIDFGDIGIGDADYDLLYLLDAFGEDFVRSFLEFYLHPHPENLFKKLYFWGLFDILQLINIFSMSEEFDEIEELLEDLENRLSAIKTKINS